MKLFSYALIFIFSYVPLSNAQEHHHEAIDYPSEVLVTSPGVKFVADATLRPRMDKIYKIVTGHFLTENKKDAMKVKTAGEQIEQTIADIFKNCKLEPAADAAVHPILATLLEGAGLLKKGSTDEGHEKMYQALAQYETKFSHEGWGKPKAKIK